jgi:hypothetical protein
VQFQLFRHPALEGPQSLLNLRQHWRNHCLELTPFQVVAEVVVLEQRFDVQLVLGVGRQHLPLLFYVVIELH